MLLLLVAMYSKLMADAREDRFTSATYSVPTGGRVHSLLLNSNARLLLLIPTCTAREGSPHYDLQLFSYDDT